MSTARFIRFVAAGGAAAAANFGSRLLLSHVMPYVPAIVVAYCIGMITAFTLNRLFVFEDASNHMREQALWFTIVNLAAVAQTVLISLLFARVVFPWIGFDWQAETVAHAIGVAVPVITSYYGHRKLTFRGNKHQ